MRRKIIIDTDPGQDDGVAILLALGSPSELDVLGVIAVAGNVILALAVRTEGPAVAGCAPPMVRDLVTA